MVSALICIPVNILLVALFRNIKPTSQSPTNTFTFHNEDEEEEGEGDKVDDGENNKKRTKNGHTYQMITSFDQNDESCRVSVTLDSQSNTIEDETDKKETKNGHTYQMITSFDQDNESCKVSVAPDSQTNLIAPNNSNNEGFEADEHESSCFKRFTKNRENKKKMEAKKEPTYLPQWVLYPAWVLNMMVVFGCAFMVIWYGMAFGNKKSLEWLTSVTIGLVSG